MRPGPEGRDARAKQDCGTVAPGTLLDGFLYENDPQDAIGNTTKKVIIYYGLYAGNDGVSKSLLFPTKHQMFFD